MYVDLLTLTFGALSLMAHVYWMYRMRGTAFLGRINQALSNFPKNLTHGMVAAVWIVFIPPFVLCIAVAHMAAYVSLPIAAGLAVAILLAQICLAPKGKTQKA
ncbi:MAG: hypothetical protein VX730_08225 [Pseudomonadota bacterium]|nr:hypothetical protein [Pseudomonadota bacterium]